MAMHVLLLHPPFIHRALLAQSMPPHMPLGLAYIGGALHRAGHRVSVIDAFVEGYETVTSENDYALRGLTKSAICSRVEALKPDLILLSIPFTIQAGDDLEVGALDGIQKAATAFSRMRTW